MCKPAIGKENINIAVWCIIMYTKQLRKGEHTWCDSQQVHNSKVVPKVMSFVECQATETRRTKRKSHSGRSSTSRNWVHYGQLYIYIYIYTKRKRVQFKSKFQHTGTWFAVTSLHCRLCNRLAVFFRHSLLTAFSFPQEKILCALQKRY